VLLRKLVNSTGQDLSLVDFPGYDQAEKKGWDGSVDAGAATPWIPMGKSGWEFGSEMRTPAMQAGLEKRRLSFRDIFSASSLFWLLGKIRFVFTYCSISVHVHDLRFSKAA
jgi:hypothetical protein